MVMPIMTARCTVASDVGQFIDQKETGFARRCLLYYGYEHTNIFDVIRDECAGILCYRYDLVRASRK